MKKILISIKPEWVCKILNGEKTIEIRKTAPKCELPVSVYIYCTKNKLHYSVGALMFNKDDCFKRSVDGTYKYGDSVELMGYSPDYPYDKNNFLNGKVVARFVLRKVDWFCTRDFWGRYEEGVISISDSADPAIVRKSCVSQKEIDEYTKGKPAYAWHIDDLEIFDEPKELSEFKRWKDYPSCEKCPHAEDGNDTTVCENHCRELLTVKRAPESFCYIEID